MTTGLAEIVTNSAKYNVILKSKHQAQARLQALILEHDKLVTVV